MNDHRLWNKGPTEYDKMLNKITFRGDPQTMMDDR